MNILSVIYRALLTVLLALSVSADSGPEWVVKGNVDLSSTFCDFRPLHFHGGIDIRTDQKEGREVFSPIDGYVWRIKYSYIGYGKGLYLKDNQGNIYVFGHLSRLSDKLEEIVKKIQYSSESYSFDKTYQPGEVVVNKGELVAYSGQSGYGPPHIHFEVRKPNNEPVNPMTNGFSVRDNIKPEFERVGFIYVDSGAVFDNGSRREFFKPEYSMEEGRYYLDDILLIRGPFGVLIDVNDRIRSGGMKLNIKKASLYIDEFLYYEVDYEKYNYDQTAMVDLSYDYFEAVRNKQYLHTLYNPPGKNYSEAKSNRERGGIYEGLSDESYGLHNGRVEIYDAAGYKQRLDFQFYYAPSGKLFRIDPVSDSSFYLRNRADENLIDIDEVSVLSTRDYRHWNRIPDRMITSIGGSYEVNLSGIDQRVKFLRIDVSGKSGWRVTDQYYILNHYNKYDYNFDYDLVDGGILFNISAMNKYAPSPEVKIVYEDGYVTTISSSSYTYNKYAAFYYDSRIKSRIVRLEIIDPLSNKAIAGLNVSIILAGTNLDPAVLNDGDRMSITYYSKSFYRPAYIELKIGKKKYPYAGNLIGKVYTFDPETMPLADNVLLSFKLNSDVDKRKIGVYKLSSKNEWVWLNSKIEGDRITAQSSLTGTFAVLKDTGAPKFKNLYPPDGKTVFNPRSIISCGLSDGLAQIKDDTDLMILLDGEWLIPEYDPETEILKTYPRETLSNGRHDLVIRATDRVGNVREMKTHFFVNQDKK